MKSHFQILEVVLSIFEKDVGEVYSPSGRLNAEREWNRMSPEGRAWIAALSGEQLEEVCTSDPEERGNVPEEVDEILEEIFEIICT